MNASEVQRKFLQTGEKQGKYLFKPVKRGPANINGKNAKHKNKMQTNFDIKKDKKELEKE